MNRPASAPFELMFLSVLYKTLIAMSLKTDRNILIIQTEETNASSIPANSCLKTQECAGYFFNIKTNAFAASPFLFLYRRCAPAAH